MSAVFLSEQVGTLGLECFFKHTGNSDRVAEYDVSKYLHLTGYPTGVPRHVHCAIAFVEERRPLTVFTGDAVRR